MNENYNLKSDAVKRLLEADKKANEDPKKDPGKKYRSGFLDRIPKWLMALFVKFWFNGAVCYFIFWGLGNYIAGFDMLAVIAIVLGMVTDLLVNNAFRFFETYQGQNSKWMMFPKKKYWTFFANIVYAFIVLVCVVWFYSAINIFAQVTGLVAEDKLLLGVEPIFFGIFYMMFDMLFVGMKNLFLRIVADAKQKNSAK